MPELPDITIYVEALERRLIGQRIRSTRLSSPFVLRTVEPPLESLIGSSVAGIGRIGKRIVISVDGDRHIVIHLMVAGRFRWKPAGSKLARKLDLAAFDFDHGSLVLTEAGSKKRASIHVVDGSDKLRIFDRGGLDVLTASGNAFRERLLSENHTVKRSLTDPRLFDGIGNAYSDEILHRARLSPIKWTTRLDTIEIKRLHGAAQEIISEWTTRFRNQTGDGFPEKVTAFRPEMAVHGKYGQACPVCGSPVQRIAYADNETNYCPTCQTEGKLLADRGLSRLLKGDWPRTLEELEEIKRR